MEFAPQQAEELLIDFLVETKAPSDADFEGLCRANPNLEGELRRLYSDFLRVQTQLVGGYATSEAQRSRTNFEVGDVIGDFTLEAMLGRGGQGEVWQARDQRLDRPVALKLLDSARVHDQALAMFHREARAGGRLRHHGIVAIHGYGEDHGHHWIAQELVPGGRTLREVIGERRSLTIVPQTYYSDCAIFLVALADALDAAHAAGIVHRDLKPQNILVAPDHSPKLTDFGVARINEESALSNTGEVLGTWYYMSPEQIRAERESIDRRSDMFSLGIVMYEMLGLQRPFEGDTAQQIAHQIIHVDPPSLHQIRSRIPRELAVICAKCLEKNREHRYGTARDFAADVRRYLNHEPIHARPPGLVMKGRKWIKRHPTKSVALALATLGLAFITGLYAELKNREESLRDREGVLLVLDRELAESQQDLAVAKDLGEQRRKELMMMLSTIEVERLRRSAEVLWPATPELLPRLESWLADARVLLEGDRLGESKLFFRPSVVDIVGRLLSDGEGTLESTDLHGVRFLAAASPRSQEGLTERIHWMRCKLGLSPWPDDWSHVFEAGWEDSSIQPMTSDQLLSSLSSSPFPPISRAVTHWRHAVGHLDRAASDHEFALAAAAMSWADSQVGHGDEAKAGMEHAQELLPSSESALLDLLRTELELWGEANLEQRQFELRLLELFDQRRRNELDSVRDMLVDGLLGIGSLFDPQFGLATSSTHPSIGWGIPQRIAFGAALEERRSSDEQFQLRWREAQGILASSEAYEGMELPAISVLLPVGADPASGLLEFADLQTGIAPERGPDGRLVLREESAVVLVLIPGGSLRQVQVEAFLLAKHELTQGQWLRLTGANPSVYGPHGRDNPEWNSLGRPADLTHPVESVSWEDCEVLSRRFGLLLPTGEQWEYACRAGDTAMPGSTDQPVANTADVFAKNNGSSGQWGGYDAWSDGYTVHAPVGSFPANSLGLHDMYGNVREWCSSRFTPEGDMNATQMRLTRGGGFSRDSSFAGPGNTQGAHPTTREATIGFRPVRALRRSP